VGYSEFWAPDVFVRDRVTGSTERVSVSSAGEEAELLAVSKDPAISADGRTVAFGSSASNLVLSDTNQVADVFVHDRSTHRTERVSVAGAGVEGNGNSDKPALSADGRLAAFQSVADNLVAGDANGRSDVFVYDRQTREATRVSVSSSGAEGDGDSWGAALSADGRTVAFVSLAANLVVSDTNGCADVFVHDRQTHTTARVSVSSSGAEGTGSSAVIGGYRERPAISADGRYVAFSSEAANLVAGDANGRADVLVHDRQAGLTTLVSVSSAGAQGDCSALEPSLSADGHLIAFRSCASNLSSSNAAYNWQVFVRDQRARVTLLASQCGCGAQVYPGNWASWEAAMSADGHWLAFSSMAMNLLPGLGDTNRAEDIFVYELGGAPPPPTHIVLLPLLFKGK